jgi:uncharacterized protein (TIGR03435 family)
MTRAVTFLLLAAAAVYAQTDAAAPAFDAASVKVSPPLPQGVFMVRMGGGPGSTDPGRITDNGVTLRALIARAYSVKEYQVEGPEWTDGERYDVIATIPKDSTPEQVRLMMQRLLADRFKLVLHHESKLMSVYTLSVGKGGPKLTEVDPATLPPLPAPGSAPLPPPPPGGGQAFGIGGGGKAMGPAGRGPAPAGAMRMSVSPTGRRFTGTVTLAQLCEMLSNLSDHPVIDLTGLTGMYAIDLSWTPDGSEGSGMMAKSMAMARAAAGPPPDGGRSGDANAANDPGLTLAQALQSGYGLKLEAKKNPADILVIDQANKVPVEN